MSDLVGNPEDRFSHNEAQTISTVMKIMKVFRIQLPVVLHIFICFVYVKAIQSLGCAIIR